MYFLLHVALYYFILPYEHHFHSNWNVLNVSKNSIHVLKNIISKMVPLPVYRKHDIVNMFLKPINFQHPFWQWYVYVCTSIKRRGEHQIKYVSNTVHIKQFITFLKSLCWQIVRRDPEINWCTKWTSGSKKVNSWLGEKNREINFRRYQ